MKELLRSNDAVLISYVSALLSEAELGFIVADANMSVMEGSLGVLPRRVLVEDDALAQAKRLLADAGIEHAAGRDGAV
ncbi:DUF2007 domain-containing protein [Methyloligella sp. 2.7D]|uniref:putative signal transducing protein n=1 Tax=unclassified Methyloligella TaxID=2625955 RepID=UPI00157D17E4|nr:DUF2007 domain-containing protein [Methyloligella sp. GL2]QKP78293.1 DUF2007 domain-containing protein [Methyloligella sp. GL2]